jgi:hypothetical protein
MILIRLFTVGFLMLTGQQVVAETIKVFECYDDMLMTTKIKNSNNPNGSVITTPRWDVQNALVFVDLSKSTLLLWQTSKKFDDIIAKQEKAHWTFKNVLISDDLISAHRRSKSEQWRDEFETLTLDLMRPKLIKTVSMENDTYRWTKHYDCKQTHGQ